MTILQAIAAADRVDPNDYSAETKLRWLSAFDGQVRKDVIDTHCGAPKTPFSGYDGTTDIETTELLIGAPYDGVYPLFLSMRIHLQNADAGLVDLAKNDFERAYRSFTDWYNRTHRPRGVRAVRF